MMAAGRFVLLLLLLLLSPVLVQGDELCFVPSLSVKEESNSNILLAVDGGNVRSDYITTVSPGFELTDRSERLDSLLLIRLDRLFYSRNEDLDATNQLYSGSVRYAATELLNLSANASYQKVFNPSLYTGWVYNPGPPPGTVIIIPPPTVPPPPAPGNAGGGGGSGSGASSTVNDPASLPLIAAPVQRLAASVSADYRLTEKTAFLAGYQFGRNEYERPKYHDTSHDAQAGITIDLGTSIPRAQGTLNTGYSEYILPNSRTINVSATVGFAYKPSELWSISLDGGIRRTESEIWSQVPIPNQAPAFAYLVVNEHFDDWGRMGHLSLDYRDQYLGAGLQYTHDFTMAPTAQGYTVPAERNALSARIQYSITRELSATLMAGYSTYRHPVNVASDAFKQDSINISPLLRYDISKDLALEASYEQSRFNYTALGTTATRDVFFVRLSARFPFCSSSQYAY